MVGSPVVPRVLSVPGSSVSLTVMARLIFEWPGLRKDLRIFENGVGSSGCLVASFRKSSTSLRGSMCFDWLHRCPLSVQIWGLWPLVGLVLGGMRDWRLCTRWEGWGKVSIIHITNNVLNFRRVLMARPVRLRTRRRDSPSLNCAISSQYCIKYSTLSF